MGTNTGGVDGIVCHPNFHGRTDGPTASCWESQQLTKGSQPSPSLRRVPQDFPQPMTGPRGDTKARGTAPALEWPVRSVHPTAVQRPSLQCCFSHPLAHRCHCESPSSKTPACVCFHLRRLPAKMNKFPLDLINTFPYEILLSFYMYKAFSTRNQINILSFGTSYFSM